MSFAVRAWTSFLIMAALFLWVGLAQSWNVSLAIFNLCLISSLTALGLNMQWGYAGLFNAGVMASTAVGGLAAILVSHSPVGEAWSAGASGLLMSLLILLGLIFGVLGLRRTMAPGALRTSLLVLVVVGGYALLRFFFDEAAQAIEAVDPGKTGFLGGLGLPVLSSWLAGGLAAAGVAWLIGRISLGLRSDYFAIATLGISEITISILKNEDWLTRGVKNVTGLERPVPYELELQQATWFVKAVQALSGIQEESALNETLVSASGVFVKLCYSALFLTVLLVILGLAVKALHSPWGRMMRAIRDNEVAASAMGKDVVARHRQVFLLGSAVMGIAGAMLTTLDGQFTPGAYNPLRFTFLIWVMVVVGGSGSNLGSVVGAFVVWFLWIEAEPTALWAMGHVIEWLDESSPLRQPLLDAAPHMRMVVMGSMLLLVLRLSPGGILPERTSQSG